MIEFTLNGKPVTHEGDPDMPLLWYVRDEAGFTGTKYGCGIAACGACTLYVDGQPTRSCSTPVSAVAGAQVATIEALSGVEADAVQAAWRMLDVVQCGYCQSGQIMAATALLTANKNPTDAEIDAAMDGNICRCATYPRIRQAIRRAADIMGA
jgi:isoquinoline 1-oxidoreductase alpha subunit